MTTQPAQASGDTPQRRTMTVGALAGPPHTITIWHYNSVLLSEVEQLAARGVL
jgi:hypothetical protein